MKLGSGSRPEYGTAALCGAIAPFLRHQGRQHTPLPQAGGVGGGLTSHPDVAEIPNVVAKDGAGLAGIARFGPVIGADKEIAGGLGLPNEIRPPVHLHHGPAAINRVVGAKAEFPAGP